MPGLTMHRLLLSGLAVLATTSCGSLFEEDDKPPTSSTCPADDGCRITFGEVTAQGSQLRISWEANFVPNIERNHLHLYWDNFTPAQVSDDAADRNVTQGLWTESASATGITTSGATSPAARAESTRICAVTADNDHRILDEGDATCIDVTAALADVEPSE